MREMSGTEGFPIFYVGGRTHTRNYVVMQNLGPDIYRLDRSLPSKRFVLIFELIGKILFFSFTMSTAMKISAQILQRLEALHSKEWIYRDIKQQNFAIGAEKENENIVYILDFGLTRKAG